MQKKTSLFVISFACLAVSLFAGPIETLQAGEWYEVPNSHLQSVWPSVLPSGSNQGDVIGPWSGGAFDTKRDRLIVWGGGHGNYAGNEIYVFDLNTLKWERVNNPSSPLGNNTPYAPDGNPTSRHTYDYIQYVASIDRFCSFGGAGLYSDGQHGSSSTDCFDFDTKTWSRKADTYSSGIGANSAYDPVTGHAWGRGSGYTPSYDIATAMCEWDPVANVWYRRHTGNADLCYEYYLTSAIDPVHRLFVSTGGGKTYLWNISTPAQITRQNLSSGPSGNSPGLDYDTKTGKLVSWSSGKSVQVFDGAAKTWSTASGTGTTPTAPCGTGTFGRFRYSPNKNVFVLVNSVFENVFLFRLTAGSGTGNEAYANSKAPILRISPSPAVAHSLITFSLAIPNSAFELSIHNTLGQRIKRCKGLAGNGPMEARWESAGAVPGIYVAKITSGSKIFTRSFAIMN